MWFFFFANLTINLPSSFVAGGKAFAIFSMNIIKVSFNLGLKYWLFILI